ncbi:MAG: hypothetical protein CL862_03070 [Cyanobium sp. NAT70]|nr:hypothetical protein [Cyanobium sp. NAT70]
MSWCLPGISLATVLLTGCGGAKPPKNSGDQSLNHAAIERLELRIDQLERQLKDQAPPSQEIDPKAPAGPIRSLTLRLGTDDDRLRLYWADGQRSDLLCSQEGKGSWACG